MPTQECEARDVLIVGAGLSGLSAARILQASGANVLVVEGRNRLGGRAHTEYLPALDEFGLDAAPVEEGCNYLHGCSANHILFQLAYALNIPTAVCAGDIGGAYTGWESVEVAQWRDAADGSRVPATEIVDALLLLEQVVAGVGLVQQNEGYPHLNAAFEASLAAVLTMRANAGKRREAKLSPREEGLIYSMRARHFGYGAPFTSMPISKLSAFSNEEVFRDPEWPTDDVRQTLETLLGQKMELLRLLGSEGPKANVSAFPDDEDEDRLLLGDGFGRVIEALAQTVEVAVGDAASRIQWDAEQGVHMTLCSGRTLKAPWAVITAPPGVVLGYPGSAAIDFVPPLPDGKLTAMAHLAKSPGRGATHEKVILRWSESCPFVGHVLGADDAPLQLGTTDRRFHFLNLHKYGRKGQLLCHIWADAEWEDYVNHSDAEIVSMVVAALRAMYVGEGGEDELVTAPLQHKVTRWSQDPFAMGAYSEIQDPDGEEADRTAYAKPEGPLHFAGEGTAPYTAGAQCVDGAVLSGVVAAVEIIEKALARTATSAQESWLNTESASEKARSLLSSLRSSDGESILGLKVSAVVPLLLMDDPSS